MVLASSLTNSPGRAIPPLAGWAAVVKRTLDYVLAAILLILLSPLIVLFAIAIKIDSPGPILFRQKRHGLNDKVIDVYKFRTMSDKHPDDGLTQAVRNDARVTRIGRLLRRTSLDELPQLVNVLNGTMSIVGPRPHSVAMNKKFGDRISGYYRRHSVKPGITGWAQVNGLRGETDTIEKMERRVKYDLRYIDNWSLLLDIMILVRTAIIVWTQQNAY